MSRLVATCWLMFRDCLAVREMDLDTSEGLERAAQRTAGNVLKKGLWQQFLELFVGPCISIEFDEFWQSRNRCMSDLVINRKSPSYVSDKLLRVDRSYFNVQYRGDDGLQAYGLCSRAGLQSLRHSRAWLNCKECHLRDTCTVSSKRNLQQFIYLHQP